MGKASSKAVWGAVALWVLIPAAALASKGPGNVDKLLSAVSSSGSPQQVIVRVKPGAKDAVKNKLARRGRASRAHNIIQALTARLTPNEILELANDPDVESVSADVDVTASAKKTAGQTSTTNTTDPYATTSGLKSTLGLENWFSGSSLTIAVIDSGISNLTDFDGRIVGFFDFVGGKPGVASTPIDEYGHGTHVSGLIGSSGVTSNGKYAGIAPGVKLLSLRVLDKRGSGKTSDVIRALEFAVANKDRYGIKVVNLSLGHPVYEPVATDPLVQAVEAAVRSGLIVVAAAGNYGTNPATGLTGYGGIASPGNAPSAITVGAANTGNTAVRSDDRVASYSSRGPSWYDGIAKPDILAPGHSMISNEIDGSTLAIDYPWLVLREGSTKYLKLNGSSMATGVVSGLIAVMLEANNYATYQRWQQEQAGLRKGLRDAYVAPPALTPNAIKAMLQYSATPLRDANGVTYDALTQGTGLVNGLGGVTLAYGTDTTKDAGAFWQTFSWPATTAFGGVEEAWSEAIIWGTRRMQGSSLVEFNQLAWDDNIVWGTGELDGVVWGTVAEDDDEDDDNIVWGTSFAETNTSWATSLLQDVFWSGNALLDDNIVWGTNINWDDSIVWGSSLIGVFDGDNIVWGTMADGFDNIVWGPLDDDNIVWGTSANRVTVLGTSLGGVQ